jgi:hypothetical protein
MGGNVFQGAPANFVVGTGVSPTTIFAPTFTDSNAVSASGTDTYTSAGTGCTIRYLAANGQNFISYAPISGLLFQFNAVYNILGSVSGGTNTTSWAGFYADWTGPHVSTTQDIGYSTFQWNTFGPSCTDIDNSETDYLGTCGGIIVHGSNVNLTIQDNNVSGQIEEAATFTGQSSSGNSNDGISTNLLIQNNDWHHVHRMGTEAQQAITTNIVIQYNDFYDPYNPTYETYGVSAACCTATGGGVSPVPTVYDNVIIQSSSCAYAYCFGYPIEAWGNGGTFNGNLIQNGSAPGFAGVFFGGVSSSNLSQSLTAINNVVQTGNTAMLYGVQCEQGGTLPNCTNTNGVLTYSPNSVSTTVSTQASTKPHISPLSGS